MFFKVFNKRKENHKKEVKNSSFHILAKSVRTDKNTGEIVAGKEEKMGTIRNPLEGNERYELISDINRGTFGFVVKARDLLKKRTVAIKFLQRGARIQQYVVREILNHKALRHPHVIEFYDIFLTAEYLAIVMEYADHGDLFLFVQRNMRLREDIARWIFQQLIFGLDYCHRKGVACRDIKLENILLQSGQSKPLVKLCDFGYSKHTEWDSAPKSRVGTPDYMAPEVVRARNEEYNALVSDIWSCGVVLYVMLVGQYPFSKNEDNNRTPAEAQRNILKRIIEMDFTIPNYLSSDCRDLLKRLLEANHSKRITIPEICEHPWHRKGLPPKAIDMNDTYLQLRENSDLPSKEKIEEIVKEAGRKVGQEKIIDEDDILDNAFEEEEDNDEEDDDED